VGANIRDDKPRPPREMITTQGGAGLMQNTAPRGARSDDHTQLPFFSARASSFAGVRGGRSKRERRQANGVSARQLFRTWPASVPEVRGDLLRHQVVEETFQVPRVVDDGGNAPVGVVPDGWRLVDVR